METKQADLQTLQKLAEITLKLSNQTKNIRLKLGKVLKEWNRNYVVRFELEDSYAGISNLNSVVVKQVKQLRPEWYAELAALQFLNESKLSPRYLGHDLENGLIVMEDLGNAPLLEDFLQGTDGRAAEKALEQMAVLVADLHGFSYGRSAEYQKIIDQLPQDAVSHNLSQSEFYLGWVSKLESWLEEKAGLKLPETARLECRQIAERLARPEKFEVFTHGDLAPSQIIYTTSGPKLLDFEYAGFRHGSYDTISWQIICPYPAELIKKLNKVYQGQIKQFITGTIDEQEYTKDYLAYCCLDLFRTLLYLLPVVWEEDKAWAPGLSGRQGVLYKLQVFSDYSREVKQGKALVEYLNKLQEILLERWKPESTNIAVWKALQSYYN